MKFNLINQTLTTTLASTMLFGLGINSLEAQTLINQATPFQTAQRGMMGNPRWRGSGGWGCCSQYGRMYNPDNQTTVSGEVVSINTFTPMSGMSQGMHLQLRTDERTTIPVHLGPYWYLQNQDITIEPNDQIEVQGSLVNFGGETVLIASQVQKGEDILILRDERGFPFWSGWRNRNYRDGYRP